ncbi:MAG: hypothetical protein LBO63_00740 [Oscillospiraceae bacterium]|jgi:hypothetical protein|nr:hypothetical protein [Oscillospiraceae bacterium]
MITEEISTKKDKPLSKVLFYVKRYRHFAWALIVAAFITLYLLAEANISYDKVYISYLPLDDLIPFVPQFVLLYFMWFAMIGFIGFWLLFTDKYAFRRYIWAITSGLAVSMVFCMIFPSAQNLRPDLSAQTGVFEKMVFSLYGFDTSTNVLPSMHVVGMLVAVFAVLDSTLAKHRWFVAMYITLAVFIVLSTVFIKQHSCLDIFAAFPFAAADYVVFYVFVKRRMEKKYAGLPRI